MVAWIIFLLVAVPLLGLLIFAILDESIVRIEPGNLGLLLVRGKATDKALDPGVHFVPALRRRMVQVYPSLELSYRAGEDDPGGTAAVELERGGPSLRVTLGDRAVARISYTVRFRLDKARLRTVHDRFGPDGIWAMVRDESSRTIRRELSDPGFTTDDLFGVARRSLDTKIAEALTEAFESDGFVLTAFSLGDVDLGRTGDVIQATARARYELEREQAEASTRVARVRNDAELGSYLTGESRDAALRYREVDVWRELVQTLADRALAIPPAPRSASSAPSPVVTEPAGSHGRLDSTPLTEEQ